jgi:hypothetical protein
MSDMPTREQMEQLYDAMAEKCTEFTGVLQQVIRDKAMAMENGYEWVNNVMPIIERMIPTDGDGSQDRVQDYTGYSKRSFVEGLEYDVERQLLFDATRSITAVDKDGNEQQYYVVFGFVYDEGKTLHRMHDENYRRDGIGYWVPEDADVGYALDEVYTIASID